MSWQAICKVSDIAPNTGVCALVEGKQVAVFKQAATNKLFAVGNYDPAGQADVLSRGMLAELGGQVTIASPLYKHHFCLSSGVCLEDNELSIPVYGVRVTEDKIEVALTLN